MSPPAAAASTPPVSAARAGGAFVAGAAHHRRYSPVKRCSSPPPHAPAPATPPQVLARVVLCSCSQVPLQPSWPPSCPTCSRWASFRDQRPECHGTRLGCLCVSHLGSGVREVLNPKPLCAPIVCSPRAPLAKARLHRKPTEKGWHLGSGGCSLPRPARRRTHRPRRVCEAASRAAATAQDAAQRASRRRAPR